MPIVVGYNSSVSSKLVGAVSSNGLRVLCAVLCYVFDTIQFSINIQFDSNVLVCACDTQV